MSMSIVDPIRWWGRRTPDATAIVLAGDQLTYGEIDRWTDAVAVDLTARGVRPGDRVGLVGGNTLEWCAAALGVIKAGGILQPINPRLVTAEITGLLAHSGASLVIVADSHAAVIEAIADRHFDIVGLDAVAALRHTTAPAPALVVEQDDPVVLVYTSGTTGKPKGVVFTHRTVNGFVHEWALMEPALGHDMRVLCVMPLAVPGGVLWCLVQTLMHGGLLVVEKEWNPVSALAALQEHRINTFFGVPIFFEQLSIQPGFADADLSALDLTYTGGSRVSAPLLRAWGAKGVILRQLYGLTEAGGGATLTPKEDAETKADFCGHGGVFTRIRVVRDDGTDCDPFEPGEIILRGPGCTPGYWNEPELTAATIIDGWLHTGDIGILDEAGYLKMVDRKKDMIISGGLNISPIEIENVIVEIPGIQEVAVIAVDDAKFGETPAAIIRADRDIDVADLIDRCNRNLADFKVPRYVVTVEEPLPRMPSGKVAKRVLREQFADIPATHPKVR